MTIDIAVEYLNRIVSFNKGIDGGRGYVEAAEIAISTLRAQQESEKNEPLTLDELRKIVQQLESCGYECEAGPLVLNEDFLRLKEIAYRRRQRRKEMGMDEFLKNICKQLEERFPDAVAVHVFLKREEIEVRPIYSGERTETSMQKIDGKWCSRRE